jgi:hypothetical protein
MKVDVPTPREQDVLDARTRRCGGAAVRCMHVRERVAQRVGKSR